MRTPIRLCEPLVTVTSASDGQIYRSRPLAPVQRCAGDWLVRWAAEAPDRIWLAERAPGGAWRTLTYSAALRAVRGLGAALLGPARDRPIVLLSGNSIAHALVQVAAMHVGIVVAPISPAYTLMSSDFARLREIVSLLQPAVVFAQELERFLPAISACGLLDATLLSADDVGVLAATPPDPRSDERFAAILPETPAKILFTSGSTGTPKGVINTQLMLCSNQAAIAQSWPFLQDRPPVVVDWLPWSHTFGGNHNFFLVLCNGGTLYIDEGKPAPGLIEPTVANLREISPTLYFNVPRGLELLVARLEEDEVLSRSFFAQLDLLFYAAAALPATTRSRLLAVAARAGREDLFFGAAWGSTETAPMSTLVHFETQEPAAIGTPAPGTAIKLAPVDGKLEIRVFGPNVTPGYWTPQGIEPPALDADGFLYTQDAVRLADPERPERGFLFEGRLGENFKLTSGTWVRTGLLRLAVIESTAPHVSDVVIAGHGRDELGILVFLAPSAAGTDIEGRLRAGLLAHNARHPSTSERIARALVLSVPPSLDAGETTDKGYINQRRVLERRAIDVERLFAQAPDEAVIVL